MNDKTRGLYKKYRVKRLFDRKHKHDACDFFVLDWKHDPFTRAAIEAYILACEKEYPELANSLRFRLTMGYSNA